MSIDPTSPTDPSLQPGAYGNQTPDLSPGAAPGGGFSDPAGTWQKFLSMSGSPASKEDVQRFFKTLLNFFTLVLKQADDAHKRAMQQQKDTMNGN